jgi:hypothetical protein
MDRPGRPLPELGLAMLGVMADLKVRECLADMRQMAKPLRPPEQLVVDSVEPLRNAVPPGLPFGDEDHLDAHNQA